MIHLQVKADLVVLGKPRTVRQIAIAVEVVNSHLSILLLTIEALLKGKTLNHHKRLLRVHFQSCNFEEIEESCRV